MTYESDAVAAAFAGARDLQGEARETFLDTMCGADPGLRAEVVELLRFDGIADHLLDAVERRSATRRRAPWVLPEISGFRVLDVLGSGGMGLVYRAEQDSPRRTVALKVLQPGILSQARLERFQREIDVLARLQHPCIAQVHDAGTFESEIGSQPWFAMELIDGPPITRFADEGGLDTRERFELFAKVCDGIQHAHERGVIHRDLKPGNVLVTEQAPGQAQPKILDFGIARTVDTGGGLDVTRTGQLIGTLPYMSPEQVMAAPERTDVRTDVYALGVLLYELLVGRLPLELDGLPVAEVVRVVSSRDPLRIGRLDRTLRGDVETIVATALAKEPNRRYASAAALAADVRRWLAHEPIAARPRSARYRAVMFARRNKALVGGVGATFVALLLGMLVVTLFAIESKRNESRAQSKAYAAEMTAASSVVRTDPLAAEEHLARAPAALRGWEWHYLAAGVDPTISSYPSNFGRLQTHWSELGAVAFPTTDRALVAVVDGQTLRVVEVMSGETVTRVGAGAPLSRPLLSADGSTLCAWAGGDLKLWGSSSPARLLVWELSSRRLLFSQRSPSGDIVPTAVSRDGRRVALTGWDGHGVILDVARGRITRCDVTARGMPVFVDDGTRVCMGGYVVDTTSGKTVRRTGAPADALVAPSPDRRSVASATWRQRPIRLHEASTGRLRGLLSGFRSHAVALAYSPDGRRLAGASWSGLVEIWNVASGQPVRTFLAEARGLVFDPTGRKLVAWTANGARVWDLENDGARVLRGHKTYAYAVAFSPDGSLVASGSHAGGVLLWDATTGARLAAFKTDRTIEALWFSADGSRLLIPVDPTIALDTATWKPVSTNVQSRPTPRPADSPGDYGPWDAVSADGRVRAAATANAIVVYDEPSGRQRFRLACKPARTAAETSHGVRMRARLARLHRPAAPSIAVNAVGDRLAAGLGDGSILVFDLKTGALVASVHAHFGPVYGVAFSRDGRRLISGSNDATVRVWDTTAYKPVAVLRGHGDYVRAVAFSLDGTRIASASGDRTVRIWDSVSREQRRLQARHQARSRAAERPRVMRTVASSASLTVAADRIRRDARLSPSQRRASLRVLLEIAVGRDH